MPTGTDPRHVRELERHLDWLDTFTGAALGVLSAASGIYTYLGVSSLLNGDDALSVFAALAYSIAVSVGIFVFWSYLMRLLPAMRSAGSRLGLLGAMALGSLAIVAMSSWLNAAALAGAAAVEQHLARTVQEYQVSLERANTIALSGQALERDVARVRQSFEDLSEQEATGDLSGYAGRGAVFRLLTQKAEELAALEAQIAAQEPAVAAAFAEGNQILSRMRALTVEPGPVEPRSVEFSEDAVRLAGLITALRQLSVAPLVARAANDLAASVIRPALSQTETTAQGQQATINSVLEVLAQRASTLAAAAAAVELDGSAGRGQLYADFRRRRGDPLCRQLRALLGGRNRDRPAAGCAGLHPDGGAGRDPPLPRSGGDRGPDDGGGTARRARGPAGSGRRGSAGPDGAAGPPRRTHAAQEPGGMTASPRAVIRGIFALQIVIFLMLVADEVSVGWADFAGDSPVPELDRPVSPGDQTRRFRPRDTLEVPARPFPATPDMPDRLMLEEAQYEGRQVLRMVGTIAPGDGERIETILADRAGDDDDATVFLHSPGGSVDDALAIGRAIRRVGLDTAVAAGDICLSACPYLFAGGRGRHVDEAGVIGVHQHYFGESAVLPAFLAVRDVQRGQARVMAYLDEMGVDPRVMQPALSTPPDEIYVLVAEELRRYAMVTPTDPEA